MATRTPWVLLVVVSLVPLVTADPYAQEGQCDSAGWPAAHRLELTAGTSSSTLYVDDENYALGNGVWVYEESNGIWVDKPAGVYAEGTSNANLQRNDFPTEVPNDNEICFDGGPGTTPWDTPPDTLLF